MEFMDVEQITSWSQGRLGNGPGKGAVAGISTDSRLIEPGECFVALRGEHFDGHAFIADAVAKGARAVVVNESQRSEIPTVSKGTSVIYVADTTKALADIARGYAEQFDIPVIAITGSNGKTSTKDMIGAILGRVWPIIVTEKNFNNEIGLPRTLFKIRAHHRAAVVEMGMRSLGEISYLAAAAQPTVGVVTNVGPVHLENLGTMERIADAKAELIEALPADGVALLNGDDERVRSMAGRTKAQVIQFGFSDHVDARAVDIDSKGLEGSTFKILFREKNIPIRLRIPGRHHIQNATAAAACALALGLSADDVREALDAFALGEMRLNVLKLSDDVVLVNDAYNASPLSVTAALNVVAETKAKRRVAVLGDMLELGSLTAEAHRDIGRRAVACGVTFLVAIGDYREMIIEGALEAGLPEQSVLPLVNAEEAAHEVPRRIRGGDVIVVKGSRGLQLERVADAIEDQFSFETQKGTGLP